VGNVRRALLFVGCGGLRSADRLANVANLLLARSEHAAKEISVRARSALAVPVSSAFLREHDSALAGWRRRSYCWAQWARSTRRSKPGNIRDLTGFSGARYFCLHSCMSLANALISDWRGPACDQSDLHAYERLRRTSSHHRTRLAGPDSYRKLRSPCCCWLAQVY